MSLFESRGARASRVPSLRVQLRDPNEPVRVLRDERCLTLEDAVEFFNLMQQLGLSETEKSDLVAFMRTL